MDSDLKTFLEAMESRIVRSTEERIAALKSDIMKDVDERNAALKARLVERMRHIETTLLTEFHKWASPVDIRVRSLSSSLRAIDADLEYLQERVKKLEGPKTGT